MVRARRGSTIAGRLSLTFALGVLAPTLRASDGLATPGRVVQVAPVTPGGRVLVGIEGPTSPDATFRWTQVEGPRVQIEDPSAARIRFQVPTVAEPLGFQVVIRDGQGEQVCRVSVPVTRPAKVTDSPSHVEKVLPKAEAGDDFRGIVGQLVALDGSRSTPLERLGFRWLLLSGPALTGWKSEGAKASFIPDQAGRYRFALLVAVGGSISEPDIVEVEVGPGPGPAPGVGSESPLARSIALAISPIPGGANTAGQVADVFEAVADRIPLYTSYAQLQSELVRRIDVVVPPDPMVRAAWTHSVFQPLSQITSLELARIGVDVRPERADRTLDLSQKGRLQELYRGLADACRPGTAWPRPVPGSGLLKD